MEDWVAHSYGVRIAFSVIGEQMDLHGAVPVILDSLDLDLSSTHDCREVERRECC